jgi:hypothetical protein
MYIDEALEMLLKIWHPKYNEAGVQDKALSEYFGLNPATFASYKAASRSPRDKQSKGMAVAYAAFLRKRAKEDPEVVKRLEGQGFSLEDLPTQLQNLFDTASKRTEPASPLKKLFGAGDQTIRISGLDYGIFCGKDLEPEPGTEVPFFNALLKRYEKQMGIEAKMDPRSGFDIEDMLRTGKAHLAACYFASARRASFANFFPVPLRISLSAVFREEFLNDLHLIAPALYEPQQALSRIQPIVVRGEVGYQHCTGVLNLKETNMVVEDTLEVTHLADTLRDLSRDRGTDRRIPCVVVDEYTATRVLKATKGAGRLALPLTSARTNRESKSRREMPEFLMSIAYSRDVNKPREEFFHDSLRIFMNTEVETTARLFADAFFLLADEVFAAIEHLGEWKKEKYSPEKALEYRHRVTATEYAWYSISLDRATVENPVAYEELWHRILRRARAIVLRDLFGEKRSNKTHQIIDAHLGRKSSPFIETIEDLQPLTAYFDHDLSLDDFRGLNRDQLFNVLEQKLNPEASQGDIVSVIEIDQSKPLTVEEKYGVETLLKQLRMSYSEIALNLQEEEKNVVRGIIGTLSEKIDEARSWKAPYAQILLAQASRNTPMGVDYQPAGLICIDSGEDHRCELRYLWVNERFRKKHIARLLLQKAIDTCSKQNCERIWVAMLPELEDAIDRVRAAGFKLENPPAKDHPELEMRLYFEYNLARERSS